MVRPLYEKLGVLYESPGFRDPLCVVDSQIKTQPCGLGFTLC